MRMFATKEQVEMLKGRTTFWKSIDYDGCDPLMLPIINIFHDYEGLTTVFCCEGHPEKNEDAYIMFAITEDVGFVNLRHFYNELVDMFDKPSSNPKEFANPYRITWKFVTKRWIIHGPNFMKPYPAVAIHVRCCTTEAKTDFYRKLYAYFSLPFKEKEVPVSI